jgi:outer membrane murein-binding lipoprotein Lpp
MNKPDTRFRPTTITKPMKHAKNLLALIVAASGLTGCISVKTQHKIDPISITVDVNVKVDRALDDFFGDLDAKAQTIKTEQ